MLCTPILGLLFCGGDMKVILIGGRANSGKDTTAAIISDIYKSKGLKTVNIQITYYIKMYAKKITNWDGNNETKPRTLLQQLGTEVIRNTIDKNFFIRRIIEDIEVYSRYFDIVTVSDCRLPEEFNKIKEKYDNTICLHITRPNYKNHLSKDQKSHITETLVDNYNGYDYEIINDNNIEDLKTKINKLIEEVDKNEKND